jgi:hypothetical protein
MTRILIISSVLLLNACGTLPAVVGTSTTTYESYKTITDIKGGVDLGLAANDKKTTDDQFLSKITGYDCKIRRVLKDGLEAICQEVEYNQKHPVLDNGEKK